VIVDGESLPKKGINVPPETEICQRRQHIGKKLGMNNWG